MSTVGFVGTLALTRVTPLVPYGYFLQWALTGVKDDGPFLFTLYRSGSANGPWEQIAPTVTNQYAMVDGLAQPASLSRDVYQRPNQLALARRFFYRVVAALPDGRTLEVVEDTDPDLDALHAQQWRRATYDFNLAMRVQGVPIAVVKRRRWGARCRRCTDAKTREIIRAGCVACWGTAFETGYWTPMLVQGRRAPAQEATTIAPEQKSDASVTRVWLPYVPQVEKDDLLVFPRDNKRLIVDQQVQTEIGTVTVHQVVTAVELNHDHILYRFPVEIQDLKPLV